MNKIEIILSVYGTQTTFTVKELEKLIELIELVEEETEKKLAQDDVPVGEVMMLRFPSESDFHPVLSSYKSELHRLKRGDKLYLSKRYKTNKELSQ
jgi:hypothetical protein